MQLSLRREKTSKSFGVGSQGRVVETRAQETKRRNAFEGSSTQINLIRNEKY